MMDRYTVVQQIAYDKNNFNDESISDQRYLSTMLF